MWLWRLFCTVELLWFTQEAAGQTLLAWPKLLCCLVGGWWGSALQVVSFLKAGLWPRPGHCEKGGYARSQMGKTLSPSYLSFCWPGMQRLYQHLLISFVWPQCLFLTWGKQVGKKTGHSYRCNIILSLYSQLLGFHLPIASNCLECIEEQTWNLVIVLVVKYEFLLRCEA